MITSQVGPDELRDCFRDPIPEIFEAAILLKHGVLAHLDGNAEAAEAFIRAADMPIIGEWLDSIWSGSGKNPHRALREVKGLPPLVPKPERYLPRDAPPSMKRELVERDGHHCRLCGIPLVRAAVRKVLSTAYPEAARWTGVRAHEQHRGLQVMWLQYDHVVVHSRGGKTTIENLVVACPACNYGRDRWMMAEVGLRDPREFPRFPSWTGQATWDGLESVLPDKSRYLLPEQDQESSMFINDYRNGQPVVAAVNGLPHSLVMGFVQFDDGVSWCDDSILNPPNPNLAHHHLYGEVEYDGHTVRCGDVLFSPVERGSVASASWNAMGTSSGAERHRHESVENELREERLHEQS